MSVRSLPGFLRRSRRYDEDENEDDEAVDMDMNLCNSNGAPTAKLADTTEDDSSLINNGQLVIADDNLLHVAPQKVIPVLDIDSASDSLETSPKEEEVADPAQASKNFVRNNSDESTDLRLSDSWQEINHMEAHTLPTVGEDLLGSQRSYREMQFEKVLVQPDLVNITELRSLSWNGIPRQYRATAWKILLGHLPTSKQRRQATLERKRSEYQDAMAQHYHINDNIRTLQEQETLRQVIVDVPRTCPDVPLFRNERIKRILTRILYIFAMRHPASSYVQGINDIASPFITVFLADYYDGQDVLDGSVMNHFSDEKLNELESDVYWCLTNLLANIQDHYTSDQPGVQRMVGRLEELVNRIDAPLCEHLREQGVEFLQFSFKWMNCLLLREFRLQYVPRLWDTYLSEKKGFEDFHVYVCAAYICQFSSQLQGMAFDELFGFFQTLQTGDWKEKEIEMLLSQAFVLSTLFGGSEAHLNSTGR